MTFQTALSGGDLTKLRSGSYSADYLMKLCANTVVFAGQLNGAISSDWAQFTYDTVTVGAYTDVVVGQVLLIGDTNDITLARFRGRVKATPTGTILYTNESSLNFADNAYFWVINTYDAQYKLSRPDASGNELIDYNTAYAGLEPSVNGLQTAYFNYDPAGGAYRIAFSVTAFAKQSGGSISAYAWTFKAGSYTVISGSLSDSAVTVDIIPGEQWGKLVVTDSAGVSKTRHFLIEACDDSVNPPDTGFDAPPISCDLSRGWTLSIGAFAGVDSVLNNTFAVVARYGEQFGGTAGGLFTDNIAFCGWLQRESNPASVDAAYSTLETATFDFNGVGAALARLNSQLVPFFNSASPSAWGYILNLTNWRAVAHYLDRYTTIGSLCDLAFDSHADTFLFPTITTQGGNALAVIQGIAGMIGSVIEFAPDGKIQMVKDITYQSQTERNADVTIADFQAQDFISLTRSQEQNPNYGITDTDGAYYNTTTGHVVGFTARAPGIARGEAEGNDNLPSQILAAGTSDAMALAELIQRATNRFEFVNNSEYLDAVFPDGYNFLIPSRQQLYTVTASALTASGVNRISYDNTTQWVLESCSITRADDGTTTPTGRFHKVQRLGTGGIDTTLVAPGQTDFAVPDLGSFAFNFELPDFTWPDAGTAIADVNPAALTQPTGGKVADSTGQVLVVWNATDDWLLSNFITLTTPTAKQVTPSDLGNFSLQQCLFDPFSSTSALALFQLASTGGNSAVWDDANAAAGTPTSVKGTNVAGVFTVIRATQTPNSILIYSPTNSPGNGPQDYDASYWLSQTYQFSLHFVNPNTNPTFSFPVDAYAGAVGILIDGSASTIPNGSAAFVNGQAFSGGYNFLSGNTVTVKDVAASNTVAADFPTYNHPTQANTTYLRSGSPDLTVQTAGNGTQIDIELTARIIVDKAVQAFPGGGTSTPVAFSTDRGATWSHPTVSGSALTGVGGFDTQRAGANSFAATAGLVERATTLGGNYSAYYTISGGANAACIIVPYFNWSGVKQTSTANPDILIGLDAPDGSSRTLLWIEGGATPGTVHDLTPVASYIFDNPNAITIDYQHHIACIGKVSSTYTLRTTTDKGSTWSNRGTLTTPHFIRGRRGDTRAAVSGTNAGQLYVAHNAKAYYSSKWAGGGIFARNMPGAITGLDVWG